MSKLVEIKNNQSFLQKFKGKKQVIDREGLLKLFDMKRKQIQRYQDKPSSNHQAIFRIKEDKNTQLQLKTQDDNRKHKSKDWNNHMKKNQQQDGVIKYSMHLNNTLKKADGKSVQLRKDVKLPAITKPNIILRGIQKNQSENLLPKKTVQNLLIKHNELQTEVSQISNTKSHRFQLNEHALQHLELMNTRLSNGQRSVVNIKTE